MSYISHLCYPEREGKNKNNTILHHKLIEKYNHFQMYNHGIILSRRFSKKGEANIQDQGFSQNLITINLEVKIVSSQSFPSNGEYI